jgi:hypothetical protein
MVQEGEVMALKQAIDKRWREFWQERGVEPDSLYVSSCALNLFTLPNIYEYPIRKRIHAKPSTSRQKEAVAMVRRKCKS